MKNKIISLDTSLIIGEMKTSTVNVEKLIPIQLDHEIYKAKKKAVLVKGKSTNNLGSNIGLFGLISKCYSNHLPLKINPHDIWILILSQLAGIVNKNPNQYRHLFTDSEDKTKLVVSGDSLQFPVRKIVNILSEKLKFDADIIMEDFSTDTKKSIYAKSCLFMNTASPFYDYGLFLCGIPSIKIGGTDDDWKNLKRRFTELCKTFSLFNSSWYDRVDIILDKFISNDGLYDTDHFKNIFTQKNVGSGRTLEIDGWITHFFYDIPSLRKLENFISIQSYFTFTEEFTGQEYLCLSGPFNYKLDGSFHELEYDQYTFRLEKIR